MKNEDALDDKGIVAPCRACGRRNRAPYPLLGEVGQCGRCKAPFEPPSVPIEVDTEPHFRSLISGSRLPVVVDFWAPWCQPCRMVAPEIVKVAAAGKGDYIVVKVNTEALPAIGAQYEIRSIPTMAVFVAGREAARTTGARPAQAIEKFVRESMNFPRSR
jgi:thioredoxin 2